MTRATDTIKAIDTDEHGRQHTRALRDDELDSVSGGDLYMHSPKGSSDRVSEAPVLVSLLIGVLRSLL